MQKEITQHIELFRHLSDMEGCISNIANILSTALLRKNKILIAGNGGSAADAQHFAAELVGRFQTNRGALPCLALTTNSSNLTAISNDFLFKNVFARQVEAFAKVGDIFIGISTSGNSENIIMAIEEAKKRGMTTIGLLGKDGGKIVDIVDYSIVVPHNVTARIQEAHIFILHYFAKYIERS